jgi:predicted MFS family arabinose efflux permease
VAGLIATSFGFNISFLVLAGIAIIGAIIFALFMPETKYKTTSLKE